MALEIGQVDVFKVKRGVIETVPSDSELHIGQFYWMARDNNGALVADGWEGNVAYCRTEGMIALIRADAVPF